MAARLTNKMGLSLAMAVWLAHDPYGTDQDELDYVPDPDEEVVSVTTLIKPVRQFILHQRVPADKAIVPDVADNQAAAYGQAIHGAIENVWLNGGYRQAMRDLGYPQKLIDRVEINPTEDLRIRYESQGVPMVPVFVEKRFSRVIDGVRISGKLDLSINGEINDTKTTSVYTWINGSNEEYYRLQMSIYRWISPDKITSDIGYIQHVFTDWSSIQARQDPKYPQSRVKEYKVELMSLQETEQWILQRLRDIRENVDLDEDEIVPCPEKDLWKTETQYKYYADPMKANTPGARSTKNFTDRQQAMLHLKEAGKGTVKTVPGVVKACGYCRAFPICTQKDQYTHA